MKDAIYAQDRIDEITYAFFASLNNEITEKNELEPENDLNQLINSKLDLKSDLFSYRYKEFIQDLDEKVLTTLNWLAIHLRRKLLIQKKNTWSNFPIVVNQYIRTSELHGRPSAIIAKPDNSVILFIQTYQFTPPYLKELPRLQVAVYARILDSLGLLMSEYIHVNYYSMIIRQKELVGTYQYEKLDTFLKSIQSSFLEEEFDPPVNNPRDWDTCAICEYNMICQMRNE